MKIRKASEKDIRKSLDIAENLNEWFTKSALKKMRLNFRRNLLIAIDKEVIGFINYKINKTSIRILWMGINRAERRRGVGRKLLRKLERIAKEKNIIKLKVSTLTYEDDYKPYNSTRNFYLKNGFVYTYIKRARKKGHDDEVEIEKRLK